MYGLEGQELPWPFLPRPAGILSLELWGCSSLSSSVYGQAQAQLRLWIKTVPRYSRRSLKSSASPKSSVLSCSWREGPGQQRETGWKGSQRQFAILMPSPCRQFVVNPAATLSARDLPRTLIAKIHQAQQKDSSI